MMRSPANADGLVLGAVLCLCLAVSAFICWAWLPADVSRAGYLCDVEARRICVPRGGQYRCWDIPKHREVSAAPCASPEPSILDLERDLAEMRARSGDPHQSRIKAEKALRDMQRRDR